MVVNGIDPKPMLEQIEFLFAKILAPIDVHRPEASAQPPVRPAVVHRRDRALHRGDGRLRAELHVGRLRRRPDDGRPVPLARQRGGRAPQRRPRRRRLLPRQLPRPHPRDDDGGDGDLRVLPARRRGTWSSPTRHSTSAGGGCSGCGCATPSSGCCPSTASCSAPTRSMYFRPGFTPEEMGSTAQAVAYLASSPAARAAHL